MTARPTTADGVAIEDACSCRRRRSRRSEYVQEPDEEGQPDEVLEDARHHRLHEAQRARLLGDELRDRRGDQRGRDRDQRVVADRRAGRVRTLAWACPAMREVRDRARSTNSRDREHRDEDRVGAFRPRNEGLVDAPARVAAPPLGAGRALAAGCGFAFDCCLASEAPFFSLTWAVCLASETSARVARSTESGRRRGRLRGGFGRGIRRPPTARPS